MAVMMMMMPLPPPPMMMEEGVEIREERGSCWGRPAGDLLLAARPELHIRPMDWTAPDLRRHLPPDAGKCIVRPIKYFHSRPKLRSNKWRAERLAASYFRWRRRR